jgi:hypothetical protein
MAGTPLVNAAVDSCTTLSFASLFWHTDDAALVHTCIALQPLRTTTGEPTRNSTQVFMSAEAQLFTNGGSSWLQRILHAYTRQREPSCVNMKLVFLYTHKRFVSVRVCKTSSDPIVF